MVAYKHPDRNVSLNGWKVSFFIRLAVNDNACCKENAKSHKSDSKI